MTMTLVETVTVGAGGAASVSFSSIPATGKDLLLKISSRAGASLKVNFNSDTANNYSQIELEGSGSAASSSSAASIGFLTAVNSRTSQTSNTFGNTDFYISNYTSTVAKSTSHDGVEENNATSAFSKLIAGKYNNSSAITSIQIAPESGTISEFATFSLYIIS